MDFLPELKNIVSKSAPILGAALSVSNPALGILLNIIGQSFGAKDNSALLESIKNDPESEIKLQQIQYQHIEELEKINAQNYQTEVDDRKSARQMAATNNYMPSIIAVSFLGIYMAVQYMVLTNPAGQDDVISARVQDILVMIVSFYFGSSHQQNRKN